MELFNEITNSFYFTAIIRILIGILLAGIIKNYPKWKR